MLGSSPAPLSSFPAPGSAPPGYTCSTSHCPLAGNLAYDQSRNASMSLLIFLIGWVEQRGRFLPDATQVVFTSVGEHSLSAASRANNLGCVIASECSMRTKQSSSIISEITSLKITIPDVFKYYN